MYKYKKSKEEIFLHIILGDLEGLIGELKPGFSEKIEVTAEEFTDIWTAALFRHKGLISE